MLFLSCPVSLWDLWALQFAQLKSSSSVLERRLAKEIHKSPKTVACTRKSRRSNLEDMKGYFNLQAHFWVEYTLSIISASFEQIAEKE